MEIKEKIDKGLSSTPKQKPCKEGEHSEIIEHPDVPDDEKDPMARVEAMRESGANQHEIDAAIHNINEGLITDGSQLSRGPTPDEKQNNANGDEQKIWAVCRKCHKKREVDQAPDNESTVEAKDVQKGWGDADQKSNNIQFAKEGGNVTYKIPKNKAEGQTGRAIHESFKSSNAQSRLRIVGIG